MKDLRLFSLLVLVYWTQLMEAASREQPTPLNTCGDRPVVDITNGTICGIYCPGGPAEICGRPIRKYKAFAGIPFAKPPVKDLRFKCPVPGEGWNGYRDGSWMPPLCPQIKRTRNGTTGQEDCLFLNVYVPEITSCKKGFPVMVFIHGGGFLISGIEEFWPNKLMTHDVILVSIQYRLGILGFLSTGDDVAPGNLALKDQELALRWVQDNIAKFGGDTSKVTIFGGSVGALSIHLQMLNPNAKGLFSRAIMMSGTALYPYFRKINHKESAVKVAKELQCIMKKSENSYTIKKSLLCLQNITATSSSQEIVMCLQDISDVSSFVDVINSLNILGNSKAGVGPDPYSLRDGNSIAGIGPVPYSFRYGEATIPDSPEQLLRDGRYNKVDVMFGICQNDGGWLTKIMFHLNENNFESIRHNFLNMEEEEAYIAKQMLQYYGITKYEEEYADKIEEMLRDYTFAIPHDYSVGLHARDSLYGSKVYAYELKHRGDHGVFHIVSPQIGKHYVDHTDYRLFLTTEDINSGDDKKLEKIMLSLWVNFATHGNPTPDHSLGFTWTPITIESTDHLVLKPEPYMEADTRCQSRKFISSLNITMNQALFPEQGPILDYLESSRLKVLQRGSDFDLLEKISRILV